MDKGANEKQIYGRRTWGLLHSMAAYYPEKPTDEDKKNAKVFIESFMDFGIDYTDWGTKFLERMKEGSKNELDASSRSKFSEWMCK